jgi:hypothetical protein
MSDEEYIKRPSAAVDEQSKSFSRFAWRVQSIDTLVEEGKSCKK